MSSSYAESKYDWSQDFASCFITDDDVRGLHVVPYEYPTFEELDLSDLPKSKRVAFNCIEPPLHNIDFGIIVPHLSIPDLEREKKDITDKIDSVITTVSSKIHSTITRSVNLTESEMAITNDSAGATSLIDLCFRIRGSSDKAIAELQTSMTTTTSDLYLIIPFTSEFKSRDEKSSSASHWRPFVPDKNSNFNKLFAELLLLGMDDTRQLLPIISAGTCITIIQQILHLARQHCLIHGNFVEISHGAYDNIDACFYRMQKRVTKSSDDIEPLNTARLKMSVADRTDESLSIMEAKTMSNGMFLDVHKVTVPIQTPSAIGDSSIVVRLATSKPLNSSRKINWNLLALSQHLLPQLSKCYQLHTETWRNTMIDLMQPRCILPLFRYQEFSIYDVTSAWQNDTGQSDPLSVLYVNHRPVAPISPLVLSSERTVQTFATSRNVDQQSAWKDYSTPGDYHHEDDLEMERIHTGLARSLIYHVQVGKSVNHVKKRILVVSLSTNNIIDPRPAEEFASTDSKVEKTQAIYVTIQQSLQSMINKYRCMKEVVSTALIWIRIFDLHAKLKDPDFVRDYRNDYGSSTTYWDSATLSQVTERVNAWVSSFCQVIFEYELPSAHLLTCHEAIIFRNPQLWRYLEKRFTQVVDDEKREIKPFDFPVWTERVTQILDDLRVCLLVKWVDESEHPSRNRTNHSRYDVKKNGNIDLDQKERYYDNDAAVDNGYLDRDSDSDVTSYQLSSEYPGLLPMSINHYPIHRHEHFEIYLLTGLVPYLVSQTGMIIMDISTNSSLLTPINTNRYMHSYTRVRPSDLDIDHIRHAAVQACNSVPFMSVEQVLDKYQRLRAPSQDTIQFKTGSVPDVTGVQDGKKAILTKTKAVDWARLLRMVELILRLYPGVDRKMLRFVDFEHVDLHLQTAVGPLISLRMNTFNVLDDKYRIVGIPGSFHERQMRIYPLFFLRPDICERFIPNTASNLAQVVALEKKDSTPTKLDIYRPLIAATNSHVSSKQAISSRREYTGVYLSTAYANSSQLSTMCCFDIISSLPIHRTINRIQDGHIHRPRLIMSCVTYGEISSVVPRKNSVRIGTKVRGKDIKPSKFMKKVNASPKLNMAFHAFGDIMTRLLPPEHACLVASLQMAVQALPTSLFTEEKHRMLLTSSSSKTKSRRKSSTLINHNTTEPLSIRGGGENVLTPPHALMSKFSTDDRPMTHFRSSPVIPPIWTASENNHFSLKSHSLSSMPPSSPFGIVLQSL